MVRYSLSLSAPHEQQLRKLIFPDSGHEGGALLLCGSGSIESEPWGGGPAVRFSSHSVFAIDATDIVEASAHHFSWRKGTFLRVLKIAHQRDLTIGFVHSHPQGVAEFSPDDNENDYHLAELVRHRLRSEVPFLSLILTGSGEVAGRVCISPATRQPLNNVVLVGTRIRQFFTDRVLVDGEPFDRQSLAFGPDFLREAVRLRIGIVGAGATGSATAMLLARLGFHHLAIFDADAAERSNVSRMHGSTCADADQGRLKVDILRDHLESLGLGTQIATFPYWINDARCRDGLRSCDLLFGCTDDHDGRSLLNRVAYFYNIPLIDMGIAIDPAVGGGVREAAGRVTFVAPGERCLLCRRIVVPGIATEEQLRRVDPEEYGRREAEGYLVGRRVPNPAVVTLTTEVACMAVDELVARLTGYREALANRLRKFRLMSDRFPGPASGSECPVCCDEAYWGRGDVIPFLDRVGG